MSPGERGTISCMNSYMATTIATTIVDSQQRGTGCTSGRFGQHTLKP